MDTLSTIKADLPEMRSQLVDCFPDQRSEIREAAEQVILWGVARTFGGWDTGTEVIPARDLYALAHLL